MSMTESDFRRLEIGIQRESIWWTPKVYQQLDHACEVCMDDRQPVPLRLAAAGVVIEAFRKTSSSR